MPLTETNINNEATISKADLGYVVAVDNTGAFGRVSPGVMQASVFNDGDFNGTAFQNFNVATNEIAATTYTLLDSDAGKLLVFSAATDVTVTLPNNLTAGWTAALVQDGVGQVVLSVASGTTTRSYASYDRTAGPGAALSLVVLSNSGANARYLISGNGST